MGQASLSPSLADAGVDTTVSDSIVRNDKRTIFQYVVMTLYGFLLSKVRIVEAESGRKRKKRPRFLNSGKMPLPKANKISHKKILKINAARQIESKVARVGSESYHVLPNLLRNSFETRNFEF